MNRQEELDYLYQEDRKFKREQAPFWAENAIRSLKSVNDDLRKDIHTLREENYVMKGLLQDFVDNYIYENCCNCRDSFCEDCSCWLVEYMEEFSSLGIEVKQ